MRRPLSTDPAKREQQLRRRFAEVLAVCLISLIPDDLRSYLAGVAQELDLATCQEQHAAPESDYIDIDFEED